MSKYIVCTLVFSLIIGAVFYASKTRIALHVWQQQGNASLALLLNDNDPELFIQLGHHYFGGQRSYGVLLKDRAYNLNRAKFAYAEAAKIDPKFPGVHYHLSRVYFAEGDLWNALLEIEEELATHPENLRSLYIRGLIYGFRGNEGDLAKAEGDFKAFVAWAPGEWAGYNDLVWILMKQEKYDEALKISNEALEHAYDGKENPWLWNNVGVSQLNLKQYTAARASFERALDLASNLSLEDWRRAYSGNNPRSVGDGLAGFRKGIELNLDKALSKS